MNVRPTTIEVLHDAAFERVNTDFVEQAANYVGSIACGGLIIEREAAIHMQSSDETTPLRTTRISIGERPADISLILTPRPLQRANASNTQVHERAIGVTIGMYTGSVIFMTTSCRPEIFTTTAIHEIGHAMGLKQGGATALNTDPTHCGLDYCAMYPQNIELPGITQTEARTIRRGLFWKKHIPAQTHTFMHQSVFCRDCSEQLSRASYNEQLRRNGLPLH